MIRTKKKKKKQDVCFKIHTFTIKLNRKLQVCTKDSNVTCTLITNFSIDCPFICRNSCLSKNNARSTVGHRSLVFIPLSYDTMVSIQSNINTLIQLWECMEANDSRITLVQTSCIRVYGKHEKKISWKFTNPHSLLCVAVLVLFKGPQGEVLTSATLTPVANCHPTPRTHTPKHVPLNW